MLECLKELDNVVAIIADEYDITEVKALDWVCEAVGYAFVLESIRQEINYLLEHGRLKREESEAK